MIIHKPVILAISEANLRQDTSNILVNVQRYELIGVMYVRNDVKYYRWGNLQNDTDAICWMDIKIERKKEDIVWFQLLRIHLCGQPDSGGMDKQRRNWSRIVNSWERAGVRRDTVVMGDLNIDYNDWRTALGQKRRLIEEVNNYIVTKDLIQ